MDVDFPPFEPSKYKVEFPFFEEKECDNEIQILGRDDVILKIKSLIDGRYMDKYKPIVISTSRGMGKTFLLKKFGTQKVKNHLKTDIVERAIATGRILSFDFSRQAGAIKDIGDIRSFFPRLMIYYLCRLFGGTQVDGIHFQKIDSFENLKSFQGKQFKFRKWLADHLMYNSERVMMEYIRLTNIAFGTTCDAPPVFLLDEIQLLCNSTQVLSSLLSNGLSEMHTELSLLLIQLAGKLKPVCICTGTNDGRIMTIVEKSAMMPQALSLTPLVSDYEELWKQLTAFRNKGCSEDSLIEMDSDKELVEALAFASCQIPRLLFLAHDVWFNVRVEGAVKNREYYIQKFEEVAASYYSEMVTIFKLFTANEIAHILLACGVHWIVKFYEFYVPGTQILWSDLIQKSLVFPYGEGCYLFPFSLIWRVSSENETKAAIENLCATLVPNLEVKDLYVSYDNLCGRENFKLGVSFETLFASSLAVKYYLLSITNQPHQYFLFKAIYDISSIDSETRDIMKNYHFNFSQGISVLPYSSDLGYAVVHCKNVRNSHDIILPARKTVGKDCSNTAVQVKVSLSLSNRNTIEKQLLAPPDTMEEAPNLLWVQLGEDKKEESYESVIFLDGTGCCNGMTLNFYMMSTK
jgi:hypothetical protein